MGVKYSRLGCVGPDHNEQFGGSDEGGFGLTLMNPSKSSDATSTHSVLSSSSRRSLMTYVYESDWSDVEALKRKWAEEYPLTVELPPIEDAKAVVIREDEVIPRLRHQSNMEEQAVGMMKEEKGIEKRGKKDSQMKRPVQQPICASKGLVKCEELSCSVSVRSEKTPSGTHKLQWVFKLYDMETTRSLDEHEVPTLMKSVCDMLSAQVAKARTPPVYKRFNVRLNIMQQQQRSRSKAVTSSHSRFVLREVRKTCQSHGDGCTSCATYAASDERSTRALEHTENGKDESEDGRLAKQVRMRQQRRVAHSHSSDSNAEQTISQTTGARTRPKSSRRRSVGVNQQGDNPQSAGKKQSRRRHHRRSSLYFDHNTQSHDSAIAQETDQPTALPQPVKLRHKRHGGSKRHSYHGDLMVQNISHKGNGVEREYVFDTKQSVTRTRQDVVLSRNDASSVVHHHHHHEHHHHHYHVYHEV